jgi:hypothetical protein
MLDIFSCENRSVQKGDDWLQNHIEFHAALVEVLIFIEFILLVDVCVNIVFFNPNPKDATVASNILSSIAQVSATFAGLLLVGMVYYLSNKKEMKIRQIFDITDILLLVSATIVFSYLAWKSLGGMIEVSDVAATGDTLQSSVRSSISLMGFGIGLVISGLSFRVTNYMLPRFLRPDVSRGINIPRLVLLNLSWMSFGIGLIGFMIALWLVRY